MILGAHEGVAGGVSTAFARADADGADCVQIFTRNVRGWAAKPLDDGEVKRFRAEAGAKQIAITLDLVKRLHDTVVGGPDPKATGEFRKEIPLHRAYYHEIAAPAKIAAMMQKLVEWCASDDFAELHPIHAASKLQHAFMQIYPYTDAPGKVARLLANVVLIHHGYQPLIVHTIDRQRYYDALRVAEPQLRDLVMDSMENSLANGEKFFRSALRARRKAVR